MKILDSDHCVALLRGQLSLAGRVEPQEELGITAVSAGELAHGAAKSKHYAENLARLDVLLSALVVLPFDEFAARRFGLIEAQLEIQGQRLSDLDLQIASIALEAHSPLATHNRAHFERLVEGAGLVIEDWL